MFLGAFAKSAHRKCSKVTLYENTSENVILIVRSSRNESNSTTKSVALYSILDKEHSPAIIAKEILDCSVYRRICYYILCYIELSNG